MHRVSEDSVAKLDLWSRGANILAIFVGGLFLIDDLKLVQVGATMHLNKTLLEWGFRGLFALMLCGVAMFFLRSAVSLYYAKFASVGGTFIGRWYAAMRVLFGDAQTAQKS